MKSLKESIFDDIEDIASNDTVLIEQFLKDNYDICGTYNIDGNVVDVDGHATVKNKYIKSLTNGVFRFRNVTGKFSCAHCKKLASLEGAPEMVDWDFDCSYCSNLVSLEGSPETVGSSFYCNGCPKLTSLEGGPKEVEGNFDCNECKKLTSLKGAPKKVGGEFDCRKCSNLTSLEGAPDKVGRYFYCGNCRKLTITDQDRKKYFPNLITK